MRKVGIIVLALTGIFILIGTTIWFFNQEVHEAYVYTGEDSSVWLVRFESDEIENKSQAEIIRMIHEKADKSEGTIYDIPWLNHMVGTDFETGDKVKVYWNGGPVFQSAPSLIKDTSLIIKMDK